MEPTPEDLKERERRKKIANAQKKRSDFHGMYKTRFYTIWNRLKWRHKIKGYEHALCCERWKKFKNFYKDMYEKYQKHHAIHGDKDTTIDRIDNLGIYSPSNCRWATMKTQTLNQRHKNGNSGKRFCIRGHEFTKENIRPQRGGRACRKCDNLYNKKRKRTSLIAKSEGVKIE